MHKIDIPSPLAKADREVEVRDVVLRRMARVKPEAIAYIEDASLQLSSIEVVEMLDRGIRMVLDDESRAAWDKLRSPEDEEDGCDDPITLAEMTEVGKFFVEAETRLPTTQPSASSNGSDGTAPSSSDSSPSPVEAASTT
jgi:hypothetical protein